jgi:hypothetical protein
MAINTHGSNIRSVTNIQGQWLDAQEATEQKAGIEHNPQLSDNLWATTYRHNREVIWQEEPQPPLVLDDDLKAAIKRDLKIRNIHTPITDSK